MARTTQAAILAEAAQWRIVQKQDRSALVAAELITRAPLVAEQSSDMDLECLAFWPSPKAHSASRAA
jgi:hypothetical protein